MIWFLTRSYFPSQTGGTLIRKAQVECLVDCGYQVKVVKPEFSKSDINEDIHVLGIPYKMNKKLLRYLERLGLLEDYFDLWIKRAYSFLEKRIRDGDIIFATSGGELGMIKLGSLLKRSLKCKFVINFHDPIDYTIVKGLKRDRKFHVSREKNEQKYIINADMIITSSRTHRDSLVDKYPTLNEKIVCQYFGYITKTNLEMYEKDSSNKLRIVYVGNMVKTQMPEILYKAFQKVKNQAGLEIYFVGDSEGYIPLSGIRNDNIKFINYLPHEEFTAFMIKNADIGFLSLSNDYFGACVPSKLYEYINLGLPVLGALPDGDAKDIIKKNKLGSIFHYENILGISQAIDNIIRDPSILEKCKKNVLAIREEWYLKDRFDDLLKKLRLIIKED